MSAPPPIPADPASRPEACSLTPALTPPIAPIARASFSPTAPHRRPLLADVAHQTEVRNLLQSVYGVAVDKVHTANYEGKKKRRGFHYYQKADYKKVYVKLRERWFPPPGFAVQAVDGDASKGHKPKTSPVKGGNQSHWLRNDEGE